MDWISDIQFQIIHRDGILALASVTLHRCIRIRQIRIVRRRSGLKVRYPQTVNPDGRKRFAVVFESLQRKTEFDRVLLEAFNQRYTEYLNAAPGGPTNVRDERGPERIIL